MIEIRRKKQLLDRYPHADKHDFALAMSQLATPDGDVTVTFEAHAFHTEMARLDDLHDCLLTGNYRA